MADDIEIGISDGKTFVLLLLLGMMEREALARGEGSMIDRLAGPLSGQNSENVVDLSLAREGAVPARWRQEALNVLAAAKQFATIEFPAAR